MENTKRKYTIKNIEEFKKIKTSNLEIARKLYFKKAENQFEVKINHNPHYFLKKIMGAKKNTRRCFFLFFGCLFQ